MLALIHTKVWLIYVHKKSLSFILAINVGTSPKSCIGQALELAWLFYLFW